MIVYPLLAIAENQYAVGFEVTAYWDIIVIKKTRNL